MDRTFETPTRLAGEVTPPGDKAIAHRALILGAMRRGMSRLSNMPAGNAVEASKNCISKLGVPVDDVQGETIVVGNGWGVAPGDLFAGNSATTMRLLAGALAGRPGEWTIAGDEFLSKRPMDRVAEPLRTMGADVRTKHGKPPLHIAGANLIGASHNLEMASGQVKSALLLAGLQAQGLTTVNEPAQSRDHTERLLLHLGARIKANEGSVTVDGDHGFFEGPGFDLSIPGDFSSAAFLIVAAVLHRSADILIRSCGLNPTRTGLLEILRTMGAAVESEGDTAVPEPSGQIAVRSSTLRAARISGNLIPRAIDELPLVALCATQAEGETVISDATELAVKESNRLTATAEGLRALGAKIEVTRDGLAVRGPTPLRGGVVDARADHRMALLFATASVCASGPVTIQGWECHRVSYPEYEADLVGMAN